MRAEWGRRTVCRCTLGTAGPPYTLSYGNEGPSQHRGGEREEDGQLVGKHYRRETEKERKLLRGR